MASCSSESQLQGENEGTDSEDRTDTVNNPADSSKSTDQTEVSGTVGTDSGMIKDSLKSLGGPQAIHHGSPDQARLDSIKAAKLKLKNPG